jgi:hypothetical protein
VIDLQVRKQPDCYRMVHVPDKPGDMIENGRLGLSGRGVDGAKRENTLVIINDNDKF